jgi:exodeoxyribonuclease-5
LIEVLAHEQHFLGKSEDIAWYEKKEAHEFDYGYALTCHKAQGSQWNSVMLIDESHVFKKDSHRWLYTAITRAAEQLVIVR